jgi:2-keto-4-pentenoate hydratase
MSQRLCTDVTEPKARRGLETAFAELRAQVAAGDRRAGWKIAVTSPDTQAQLGLTGPLLGALTISRIWDEGDALRVLAPGLHFVEVELALRLGRDVAPSSSLADCAAAIDEIAPAIEILSVDGPFDDVEVVLAKNAYHAGVVFGRWSPVPDGFSVEALSFDLKVDGVNVAQLDPSLLVGEPAEVVRFVADLLANFGERLEAGQRIICGVMNPTVRVRGPARIEALVAPLGRVALQIAGAPGSTGA